MLICSFFVLKKWFIDQNYQSLEREDEIKLTLNINGQNYNNKMRDTIKPIVSAYEKLLAFSKNMCKRIGRNIIKDLNPKYCHKFLIMVKILLQMPLRLIKNRATQKTAKATDEWIAYLIADKITTTTSSKSKSDVKIPKDIEFNGNINRNARQKDN